MKKLLLYILFFIVGVLNINSQTTVDALKYIQNELYGTARYVGMGGSFGALGGEPSAIKDNPAALGIYRTSSEINTTMNTMSGKANSNWYGNRVKNSF